MKFKKELCCILLILIAFILFLIANNNISFVFSALLTVVAFNMLGMSRFVIQLILKTKMEEPIHPIVISAILVFIITATESNVSANMTPLSLDINKNFESELTDIFNKYEISTDSDKELVQLSCALENRLTYILASASSIKETSINSAKRYKNLMLRRKGYAKNISKINKRNKNAGEELLIVDIPNINITDVGVKETYKRVLIYARQIERDLNSSSCDNSCKYRNIDKASLQIIKEFDTLKAKMDDRNFELTQTEKSFDKLEEIQRKAELKLLAKGF